MLQPLFYEFVMQLIDPYLQMQLQGVKVDLLYRDKLRGDLYAKQQEAVKAIERLAGRSDIVAKKGISNKALQDLLYNQLKLPVQRNRKTGQPTTNEDALDKLHKYVKDEDRPIFEAVLTVRELGVLISTFLDAKLDEDMRLRASYNVGGTETGRLSSSSSPFWTGTNMQNWEHSVRNIVVADPGEIFLYGDGEQAEARVVAYLTGDKDFMAIFEGDKDIHAMMASLIFGVPYEEIIAEHIAKEDEGGSERRYLAKRTVHASHYGMSWKLFSRLIRKPEALAMELQNRYFAQVPAIKSEFQMNVRREIDRTRMLSTPFGRKRQFFGRIDDTMYREGYAYVPQATIADWLNIGLLRVWRWCKQQYTYPESERFAKYLNVSDVKTPHVEIKPAINIHDGLLSACDANRVEDGIEALKQLLTFPIWFGNEKVHIPADIKIGTRWGTLRKATPEWIKECKDYALAA